MLFVGTIIQAVSSAISGLAINIVHIYIGRILYEMRSTASIQVLINRWFVKKRGKAQSIAAAGMPLGAVALIPLSQYLIISWGWRTTMLFWAGVVFVIMLGLTFFVKDRPEDTGVGVDGEPLAATPEHLVKEVSFTQARVEKGSTLSESLRTGAFWLLLTTAIICGIGCGFMMTHIVIFATDIGYSEMIGASFLSIHGVFTFVGVLFTGYLSDRIARKKVLALTHLVRGLSFVTIVLSLIFAGGPLWLLYIAMALFGLGWFTTAPLASGLVADLFGYLRMGTIVSLVTAGHMIGTAIGVYGGGITFEMTHSYHLFFFIQGGLEFLAAIFAFAIRRRALY